MESIIYSELKYMEFIILVIILILLWITVMAFINRINANSSNISQSLNESYPFVIIDNISPNLCNQHLNKLPINDDQLTPKEKILKDCRGLNQSHLIVEYCGSWGYIYSTEFDKVPTDGYTLFLYEPVTNININQSLSMFMNLGSNTEYIAFDNCDDYIINSRCKLTNHDIQEEIKNINLPVSTFKTVLSEGFPYLTPHGLILHRSYIDNIFRHTSYHNYTHVIMPSSIPRRYRGTVDVDEIDPISNKIPKFIHQTFQTRMLPEYIATAAYTLIDKNPEYKYHYYDDHDQREFILNNFDSKVVQAYDRLIPGAYKADLWRYCVIYIEGGVYVDIKMGALVPLSKIIDADADLVIVNDTHNGTIYNAFFAAVPRHPAIGKTIDTVIERVLNGEYGEHMFYPTGPMAMGYSILSLYGYVNHIPDGKHVSDKGIIKVYSHITRDSWTTITDMTGTDLIRTRHSRPPGEEKYLQKITGYLHYRLLWGQKDIYR